MTKHGSDSFQINSIRNHPAPEAMTQVVEAPTFEGLSIGIDVANPDHLALLVPLLNLPFTAAG